MIVVVACFDRAQPPYGRQHFLSLAAAAFVAFSFRFLFLFLSNGGFLLLLLLLFWHLPPPSHTFFDSLLPVLLSAGVSSVFFLQWFRFCPCDSYYFCLSLPLADPHTHTQARSCGRSDSMAVAAFPSTFPLYGVFLCVSTPLLPLQSATGRKEEM